MTIFEAQELINKLHNGVWLHSAVTLHDCSGGQAVRKALAEAFIAGTRSAGLRMQPRARMLDAFEVPPETKPAAKAKGKRK
jgi:hypothetical protein